METSSSPEKRRSQSGSKIKEVGFGGEKRPPIAQLLSCTQGEPLIILSFDPTFCLPKYSVRISNTPSSIPSPPLSRLCGPWNIGLSWLGTHRRVKMRIHINEQLLQSRQPLVPEFSQSRCRRYTPFHYSVEK
jgi:hypothetical protein